MNIRKTTKEQYKLFQGQCWKVQKFFGLTDFDVVFEWLEKNKEKSMADFELIFPTHLVAKINLFKTWYGESITEQKIITDVEIKQTAFHEVCHLLFCDLLGNVTETDETRREEHRLINRLQNLLLDENGDLRI